MQMNIVLKPIDTMSISVWLLGRYKLAKQRQEKTFLFLWKKTYRTAPISKLEIK